MKNIILRDKSDLNGIEEFIPNSYIVGAMEKSDHIPVNDIKVISNKKPLILPARHPKTFFFLKNPSKSVGPPYPLF